MVFLSAFRVRDRAGAIPGILMNRQVSLKEARLRVKDATIWRGGVGLILVVGASVVCRTDSFRDAFPSPRETLRAVGPRLSRSWSARFGRDRFAHRDELFAAP
jgi:hypothetical protein